MPRACSRGPFDAGRIENLPKLVEDIVQTSINTGPRGVLRLVQGVQAFVGVGGEWLNDISKVTVSSYVSKALDTSCELKFASSGDSLQLTSVSGGLPTEMQLGLLSPLYLRKLFERMGATYIKLGQVILVS